MDKLKELNQFELTSISGGGRKLGFLLAAYVDFEIGMANALVRQLKRAFSI